MCKNADKYILFPINPSRDRNYVVLICFKWFDLNSHNHYPGWLVARPAFPQPLFRMARPAFLTPSLRVDRPAFLTPSLRMNRPALARDNFCLNICKLTTNKISVRSAQTTEEAEKGTFDLLTVTKMYTSDLQEMGLSMKLIRRNVAGSQNDLRALRVYQDALQGSAPSGPDDTARLERVLREMNELRLAKAKEELFWAERQGRVVSPIVDDVSGLSEDEKVQVGNVLTNITMYGVQGATWNALILLTLFITLVTFVLR